MIHQEEVNVNLYILCHATEATLKFQIKDLRSEQPLVWILMVALVT